MKRANSRRKFVKKLAATSLVTTGGAIALLAENANIQQLNSRTSFSANDQINLGFIGMGIMKSG